MSPLPSCLPYSTTLTAVGVDSFKSPLCWSKDGISLLGACPAALPSPAQSLHSGMPFSCSSRDIPGQNLGLKGGGQEARQPSRPEGEGLA